MNKTFKLLGAAVFAAGGIVSQANAGCDPTTIRFQTAQLHPVSIRFQVLSRVNAALPLTPVPADRRCRALFKPASGVPFPGANAEGYSYLGSGRTSASGICTIAPNIWVPAIAYTVKAEFDEGPNFCGSHRTFTPAF